MSDYGFEIKDGYFKGEVLDSQFGVVFNVDFEFLPTDVQIAICTFAQNTGIAGNPEFTMERIANLYASSWQLDLVEKTPTLSALSERIKVPNRNWEELIKEIAYILNSEQWVYAGSKEDSIGKRKYTRHTIRHESIGASLIFTPLKRELLIEAEKFINGKQIIYSHDIRAEMLRPEPGLITYPDFKSSVDLFQPLTPEKIICEITWLNEYLDAWQQESRKAVAQQLV